MRYLLFSLLLALAACSPPDSESATGENASQTLEGEWQLYPKADGKPYFHAYQGKTALSDLQVGRVVLRGDSASRRLVLENGIELRIFREGVLYLQMNAEKAISLPPYEQFDFPGMTSFSMDSLEVEVEKMRWKTGEPLVSTAGFVQMVTQRNILEGMGLEASLDFEYYAIEKVTAVIDLGEGGK